MSVEYREYAKDRAGWFFGLSGWQLAVVVLGGGPELIALNSHRWLLLAGWLPVWAAVAALAVVPVRGWTAAQWLLVLTHHAIGAVAGWTRWQSPVAAGTVTDPAVADLPGVLAGVHIHDGPPFGAGMTRVAVVQDRANRTWAAVARIAHPGIGMAEPAALPPSSSGWLPPNRWRVSSLITRSLGPSCNGLSTASPRRVWPVPSSAAHLRRPGTARSKPSPPAPVWISTLYAAGSWRTLASTAMPWGG